MNDNSPNTTSGHPIKTALRIIIVIAIVANVAAVLMMSEDNLARNESIQNMRNWVNMGIVAVFFLIALSTIVRR